MAATATRVTMCVVQAPITRPIIEGDVAAEGLDLRAQAAENIDNVTRRMLKLEYDVGEMSLATFLKARAEGLGAVGLPFFTSGRAYPQRGVLFATRAGISRLEDLKGKRVAAPQYWFTPTVWLRWILQDQHGVAPSDMSWVLMQPERFDPPGIPDGVRYRYETSGRKARELMAAGELDASFGAIPAATPGDVENDEVVTRAYPSALEAQREFVRRTGISVLQHITVIREELAQDAALVASICEAYRQAKERVKPTAPEGMADVLGADPWALGITANRRALEALVAASHAQGLIPHAMAVEDFFAPTLPVAFR